MAYFGCATKGAKLRWATVFCCLFLALLLVTAYVVQLSQCTLCYSDGSACVSRSRWTLGPLQDDPDAANKLHEEHGDDAQDHDYDYSTQAAELGMQSHVGDNTCFLVSFGGCWSAGALQGYSAMSSCGL